MFASRSFAVFLCFLRRDFFVYSKQIKDYIINYSILFPILLSTVFGYILPYAILGITDITQATTIFASGCLIIMVDLTFALGFDLLFDLENKKFIEYQIRLLNPRLVIIQRITFATVFTFLLLLPVYFLTSLLLYNYIDLSNTSWPQVYTVLLCSSLVCASYQQLGALVTNNSNRVIQYWTRFNIPLILFGGFWTPYAILKKFSPTLAYINLANPIIYITEGLRQSVVGGPQFLPFWFCIVMMLTISLVCTLATFYLFKKRVDHI